MSASRQSSESIDIIHTLTTLRPELLVDVVPHLVSFLCRQLQHVVGEFVEALARLLSALGHRRPRQSQRHTPLVIALGKHAPAILAAYVRGLADRKNPISVVHRRLLQASVYHWCDMIVRAPHRGREGEGIGQTFGVGEGGEAEKEIWAGLWRQWTKQRYRGQG